MSGVLHRRGDAGGSGVQWWSSPALRSRSVWWVMVAMRAAGTVKTVDLAGREIYVGLTKCDLRRVRDLGQHRLRGWSDRRTQDDLLPDV
ncbi:hypothetical protein [Streptomyces fagopyri]|uniref:hypothetical protein n=1 Tax=Streptomyces fagopyri TaxID=2662397 RepID=UPI0033EA2CA2